MRIPIISSAVIVHIGSLLALYQDDWDASTHPGLLPAWNTHEDPTGHLSATSQERDHSRRRDDRKRLILMGTGDDDIEEIDLQTNFVG